MKKNMISFYLYRIFSRLYFHVPMLFVYFYTYGISVVEIEFLLAVYGVVLIIAPKIVVKFKNKYKQKSIIIVGELIKIMGLLCFVLTKNIFVLIIGQIFSGLGYSFIAGTDSNLLKLLFGTYKGNAYDYKKVEANSNSYMFVAFLGAGVLGSVLFQTNNQLIFICSIASSALAIISTCFITEKKELKEPQEISIPDKDTENADVVEELKDTISNQSVVLQKNKELSFWKNYYALSRAVTLATFVGFLPYYFFLVTDVNLYYFSAILSLFNLFGFVSSRVVIRLEQRFGNKVMAVCTSAILIVAFIVFSVSDNIIISIINLSLLGLASGIIRPITMISINQYDLIQSDRIKIVSSMEQIYGFWNASLLIIGGIILNYFGFQQLMLVIMLVYLLLILINVLRIRVKSEEKNEN